MSRTPLRLLAVGLLAAAAAYCGRSPVSPSGSPSGNTGPADAAQPTPMTVTLGGQVQASGTSTVVPGAKVDLEGRVTTTDDLGRFRFDLPPGAVGNAARITLGGPSLLERTLHLSFPASREVTLDAIRLGDGFDLAYYRRLVRDDLDNPGLLRTLRRWTTPPRIYVRSVDEAGTPVDAVTLDTVVNALQDDAGAWTGGRFGLAGLEVGTGTREGVNGWITVKWVAPVSDERICGRAQIATNGGWIEFNHLRAQGCGCGGSRIGPKTVRHELGHAMGFYHTGESSDVMMSGAVCEDRRPSPRERLHAAIAYSRAFGNADPDRDPIATLYKHAPPVVITD